MNHTSQLVALRNQGGDLGHVRPDPFDYAYDDDFYSRREAVDLRAVWAALYRNKFLIAGIVMFAILAGLAAALFTAPRYRAVATVQIDQQTAKILESQDVEPIVSGQDAERFLQTQVDVLRSRSLAERVVQSLKLDRDGKFIAAMENGAPAKGEASFNDSEWRERVLGAVRQNLSVELPRNSRVAKIQFESPNPQTAAALANSYADNYITSNLQRRYDMSAYSREFLEGQLGETKRRLEASERELIAYARAARLIDASTGVGGGVDTSGPKSLTTSNLVQLNQAYSQARSQRVQAQQRWAQAQATPITSLPEVLSNPTVQQLTQRRAELQAEYQEERERRKEEHPAVMQAAARIRELDRQINSVSTSIRNSIRDQYQVAAKQEQALQGNVGQLKGETLAEQDRSVRYNILKREVDTSRQLYEGLLQRFREVSAAAGITTNNISVIDRAVSPTRPVWPKPMLNMALGGTGGLVLALLLVFLREKFDDAVRAPEDVDRKLNLTLLGTVPLLPKGTVPREALEDPRSAISEAHAALRTSLELSSGGGLAKTLLLTSTRPGEGKSTTAYAIAKEFAQSGKSVLLIDSDMRKPSLHRMVGTKRLVGLSNVLARQKSLEEVVQETSVENLFFVPSGPTPPNVAQLLGSTALRELLPQLSKVFDLLVIDAPPVLGLADAPRLSHAVDATIFIVEAGGSNRGRTKAALKRLLDNGANVLGVVLTKFDARKSGYGGYGYDYYAYGVETSQPEKLQHLAA